jgi:hypothetical protein
VDDGRLALALVQEDVVAGGAAHGVVVDAELRARRQRDLRAAQPVFAYVPNVQPIRGTAFRHHEAGALVRVASGGEAQAAVPQLAAPSTSRRRGCAGARPSCGRYKQCRAQHLASRPCVLMIATVLPPTSTFHTQRTPQERIHTAAVPAMWARRRVHCREFAYRAVRATMRVL